MSRPWLLLFLIGIILLANASARKIRKPRSLKDPALMRTKEDKLRDLAIINAATADCSGWSSVINGVLYPWKTSFFDAKIDHFSYSSTATYPMRYFLSNCFYKPGGPIFFYTGNEGDLVDFATNTGIMWDLAPTFNAAIIFAEHRFYGVSMPFGNNSYANIQNLGYLTSEQALADYADFLLLLKTPKNGLLASYNSSTPVIAFGGSYGGMLAAWMRMKYPHLIVGSWASSAPLLYVENGGVSYGKFDNITTRTYMDAGCNRYIMDHWPQAILNLSSTSTGCAFLNTNMNIDNRTLINGTDSGWNLVGYIREGLEYMAMVDYPYSSSFLTPMPGFPVNVAAQYLNAPGTSFSDQDLAMMAYYASQVYYNTNGTGKPYCIDSSICGDTATAGLGMDLGWPWQECSEIIMMMCSQGEPNDFFWDECGDNLVDTLAQGCVDTFGYMNWTTAVWNLRGVEVRFGLSLQGHSRIILTQGYLDPWSGGGYNEASPGVYTSNGIYAPTITGSAHHLDLRTPNTCDPAPITYARYQIVNILLAWVDPHPYNLPFYQLPTWDKNYNVSNCSEVINGYPWNQKYPSSNEATLSLLSFTAITLLARLF